ncbi:MAG: hypothetical protein QY307_06995 [Acidimicrobiia bacterium]|nr:MAG: hypothetical protein QY307_06995 [Acidimicrobiia bacterium]
MTQPADEGPDFPVRIAEFLEALAERIRSLTVDRVARVITFITLGMVAMVLVATAFIFFLVGLFRLSDRLIYKLCDCGGSMEIAYAVVGGVFLLGGALLWAKRTRAERQ